VVASTLGGLTLNPGVYSGGALDLTGTLTLDAQGDPGAVFIFQAASTLITASASQVKLVNGASACNVFWKVGSSATFGTTTSFGGTAPHVHHAEHRRLGRRPVRPQRRRHARQQHRHGAQLHSRLARRVRRRGRSAAAARFRAAEPEREPERLRRADGATGLRPSTARLGERRLHAGELDDRKLDDRERQRRAGQGKLDNGLDDRKLVDPPGRQRAGRPGWAP
jgi:hypothetical protein